MEKKRLCAYCAQPYGETFGARSWVNVSTVPPVARCPKCDQWNKVELLAIAPDAPPVRLSVAARIAARLVAAIELVKGGKWIRR